MRGAAPPCHRGHPGPGPGRTAPGRSPQGAKSPYETIFKWPPPEIGTVLVRLERFPLLGGYLEVTSTAAKTRPPCTHPQERQKPFPSLFLSFKTGRRPFLEFGGFRFRSRSSPYLFLLFYETSLRPPRRRGPSFCVDRKKAKSDQGCALDPDGQRRQSLKNGPFDAAQSAWAGVLSGAMIDVCLGGSMLGRAAGCGVGNGLQPLKWVVAPAPSLKLA